MSSSNRKLDLPFWLLEALSGCKDDCSVFIRLKNIEGLLAEHIECLEGSKPLLPGYPPPRASCMRFQLATVKKILRKSSMRRVAKEMAMLLRPALSSEFDSSTLLRPVTVGDLPPEQLLRRSEQP